MRDKNIFSVQIILNMLQRFLLLLLYFMMEYLFALEFHSSSSSLRSKINICQPLESDYCSHKHYNLTSFPNMFGHRTQNEANYAVSFLTTILNQALYDRGAKLFGCIILFFIQTFNFKVFFLF